MNGRGGVRPPFQIRRDVHDLSEAKSVGYVVAFSQAHCALQASDFDAGHQHLQASSEYLARARVPDFEASRHLG